MRAPYNSLDLYLKCIFPDPGVLYKTFTRILSLDRPDLRPDVPITDSTSLLGVSQEGHMAHHSQVGIVAKDGLAVVPKVALKAQPMLLHQATDWHLNQH